MSRTHHDLTSSSSPSDFDKRVNDNKTAAEDAMKKIPAINATIMAANEKTRQAESALGNAAADAREAKNKAEEAERIASNVQKVNEGNHDYRLLSSFQTLTLTCLRSGLRQDQAGRREGVPGHQQAGRRGRQHDG